MIGLAKHELRAGDYQLVPLAEHDAPGLLAMFGDPAVAEFMDIDPLEDLSQARDIIDWARELASEERGLRWSIRRIGERQLIGTVGFNSLELERGCRGEIAYDLVRAEWGKGVMSAVLPHVLSFGYGPLGLRRLEAMVTVGNERSCKLLERHGFSCEGTLRDHAYWKGAFWDQLIYARLAD